MFCVADVKTKNIFLSTNEKVQAKAKKSVIKLSQILIIVDLSNKHQIQHSFLNNWFKWSQMLKKGHIFYWRWNNIAKAIKSSF